MVEGWDTLYPNIKKWLKLVESRPSFANAFRLAEADLKERIAKGIKPSTTTSPDEAEAKRALAKEKH
ncbi:hypothetical protein DICPUDRAFT_149193 [Dictyostelium purpureum]|uniref:Uncharacterized protein n=1 Tax=Dictyostelium purpureum TaxID=5786 RepID=F0ZD25_DICPU|nr:uncharacterized protein DICPUDRAFT_149193 [Dictyostelium purpureum]EGC38169.1 hypothetical protein DICPUDRAFT_149193 [Dictyostelium purpureum]|eukprot:XP_003285296.1 hypothetical protein DICPUDRAFT_149193 [Dictyostelium purpureum]